jgi:hypothetical protein
MIAAWLLGGALCMATGDAGAKAPDADRAAYEAAAAAAGRDAAAHVDLALWCESRGMPAEKARHLARAILLDPEDERARGLLGQMERDGRWMRPADVVRVVDESPDQQALLGEYLERRAGTADKADDQYKLALWCEENGLKEPMVVHLRRTLQLDPGREGAWRRLGFKKVGNRWVNAEVEAAMKAEREARAKAEKEWTPRLEKLRGVLAGKDAARRAEAREELAAITDPRAVPSLFRVFARGGVEARQALAVDVLSRIEGAEASLALATLAVYSPHAAIRTDAAALLQRRDPREFAGFLALQIRDEVKYKVKPVGGPGSQGELLVEGEDANVRRIYRPMQAPQLLPGDRLGRDQAGNVIVNRPVGTRLGPRMTLDSAWALMSGRPVLGYEFPGMNGSFATYWNPPARPDVAAAALQRAGVPAELSQTVVGRIQHSDALGASLFRAAGINAGLPSLFVAPVIQESFSMPVQQMMEEARASAFVAGEQLAADVAGIEAHNAPIRETNERAIAVLKAVSGEDRGTDRDRWMNWVLDLQGFAQQPAKVQSGPPATIVEEVPIAFQPQAVAIPTTSVAGFVRGSSCFAGGTPVRTLRGDRPIESIRPGDLVLSQDPSTGRLAYKAVLEAIQNPPDEIHAIALGDGTVRSTGIHRFWKTGHGWVMARDLKPGDRLRGLGGAVEVASVEKEPAQPVFNLLVSGGVSYFVGEAGLLAHDASLVEPVAAPFDAVPDAAELVAASQP